MSVHTLREYDGMVQIGAAVTKAEALAAGPQILKFCYEVNDQTPPIVLERLNWHGADRTVHHVNGVKVNRIRGTIHLFGCELNATTARLLARVLAEMAEDAENEPDPAQVEMLAEFFDDEMDASPEELARQVLRRFNVEERAS
ncbi:hypothetical protein [Actinomadura decatromicini]|uniref:Uncharacterized protein n=1 Tax=Actinomadura decatromicini TaxID=2604572 RepID=A0A5D3FBU1_9ACTN|nr:hypothetical protein [Actinomadura decatromicini]TYK45210.1 hypothetical protein FXF68_31530 [Actinomadura decatromicini]